jgi:hypothetical protein
LAKDGERPVLGRAHHESAAIRRDLGDIRDEAAEPLQLDGRIDAAGPPVAAWTASQPRGLEGLDPSCTELSSEHPAGRRSTTMSVEDRQLGAPKGAQLAGRAYPRGHIAKGEQLGTRKAARAFRRHDEGAQGGVHRAERQSRLLGASRGAEDLDRSRGACRPSQNHNRFASLDGETRRLSATGGLPRARRFINLDRRVRPPTHDACGQIRVKSADVHLQSVHRKSGGSQSAAKLGSDRGVVGVDEILASQPRLERCQS